jgi:hypothetical protein
LTKLIVFFVTSTVDFQIELLVFLSDIPTAKQLRKKELSDREGNERILRVAREYLEYRDLKFRVV